MNGSNVVKKGHIGFVVEMLNTPTDIGYIDDRFYLPGTIEEILHINYKSKSKPEWESFILENIGVEYGEFYSKVVEFIGDNDYESELLDREFGKLNESNSFTGYMRKNLK